MKFVGTKVELDTIVDAAGVVGVWHEKPNGVWRFLARDGAGMNWSSTKGTYWFDGPQSVASAFKRKLEPIIAQRDAPVLADEKSHPVF